MKKSKNILPETTKITLFKGNQIRKTLHNNEWYFSVVDVVEALTNSDRPSVYWTAMKARVQNEGKFELSTICRQLKLPAPDGKMRETDCADTEGMFRIIDNDQLSIYNFQSSINFQCPNLQTIMI